MRLFFFYLVACAALFTGCQPVTPTSMKGVLTTPKLTIKDDTFFTSTQPESSTPPKTPVTSETLSSSNVDQNSSQTEIDLTISTATTDINTQTSTPGVSPDIKPQIVAISKTFDPTKIIGLATKTLIRDLGKANLIRREGSIEVWQYHFTSCVIDFFFYPFEKGKSQLIAKNWNMRSTVIGNGLDRGKCRAEMDLYHQKITDKP